jgi:hypothetical protein
MNNHRLRIFSLLVATAMQLIPSPSRAASTPVWTFEAPPLEASATGSILTSVTADAVGNTLIIIQNTISIGGNPFSIGTQIFLLDGRGRLQGRTDLSGPASNLATIFVSAKKAIITSSGFLLELTIAPHQSLNLTETLAGTPDPAATDRKFIFTSVIDAGIVKEVRCYPINKLKP